MGKRRSGPDGKRNLAEAGQVRIREVPELDLAIVDMPPDVRKNVHALAINNATNRTRVLLTRGQHVEFHYRYETWVQLATRRPPARVDLGSLVEDLNAEETSGRTWAFDGVDAIVPRLYLGGSHESSVPAEAILAKLERHLRRGRPAWNPHDG